MLTIPNQVPPAEEVFAKIDLPSGPKAVVFEGYGRHYFNALRGTKGDTTQLIKFLIVELLEIEGKRITEEEVDKMHIRDISYVTTVIMTMMSDGIPGLPGL